MKRLLFALMACAILAGCGNDKKKDGSPGEDTPDGPVVIIAQKKWGDLPCQKSKSCENKVLNAENDLWMALLRMFSTRKAAVVGDGSDAFTCGADFFADAQVLIGSKAETTGQDIRDLTQFAQVVLDLETCQVRADRQKQLDLFFNKYIKGELK